jgi:hypothetical protein
MTQQEYDSINADVRAVDERFSFAVNSLAPNAVVIGRFGRDGRNRLVSPLSADGKVSPFEITTPEETRARAIEAAKELREFAQTKL